MTDDLTLTPAQERTLRLMPIASHGVARYLVTRGLRPTEAEWQVINRRWGRIAPLQVAESPPDASDEDVARALVTSGIAVCVLVLDPRSRAPRN